MVNTDLRFKRNRNSRYLSRSISHPIAASNSPKSARERLRETSSSFGALASLSPSRLSICRVVQQDYVSRPDSAAPAEIGCSVAKVLGDLPLGISPTAPR